MNSKHESFHLVQNRRGFLRRGIAGAAGLAAIPSLLSGCASRSTGVSRFDGTPETVGRSRVAFVTGSDRRDMIIDALRPFEDTIRRDIQGKQVVVKINCVVDSNPLIATHPDAVRGILDFLEPLYDRQIVIGESTASAHGTRLTFEQYGFLPLEKEYNVRLVELNDEPTTWQWILDPDLYPTRIRVINTFLDPDNYIISVTRLKTHNCVVATLTLKNVVMGSPLKIPAKRINDKSRMHATSAGHRSPKLLNANMFLMAHRVRPDFAVLDGFEGVEGNGPTEGEPVDHKVALAGPDFLSVDRIGAELMGIPWENIGYLQYCATGGLGQGDRSKISIIGPDPKDHVIAYRLHENIDWQMTWKDDLVIPGVERN